MNIRNNKRAVNSQEAIEKAYIGLLDTHGTSKITVQSICKLADVNRTTFYAHYTDLLDLQKKIEEKLSIKIKAIFEEALTDSSKIDNAICRMFYFIEEHKVFYRLFLKHNNMSVLKSILAETYSETNDINHEDYHISFFTAGVSEVIRIWLNNDCREKPEELAQIIYDEYCRV